MQVGGVVMIGVLAVGAACVFLLAEIAVASLRRSAHYAINGLLALALISAPCLPVRTQLS